MVTVEVTIDAHVSSTMKDRSTVSIERRYCVVLLASKVLTKSRLYVHARVVAHPNEPEKRGQHPPTAQQLEMVY
jgi:hypothetical protein